MDTILCARKPPKGSKSETMTIPKKHIDFAKDNLARIAVVEMVPRTETKLRMKMENDIVAIQNQSYLKYVFVFL